MPNALAFMLGLCIGITISLALVCFLAMLTEPEAKPRVSCACEHEETERSVP